MDGLAFLPRCSSSSLGVFGNIDEYASILLESEYHSLNSAFEGFTTLLDSIQNSTRQKWEQYKLFREHLEKRVNNSAVASEAKVRLNVGGQVFMTSEATLLAEKETFFWAMLHGGQWKPDTNGEYFIDRNPATFSYILDYLRSGTFDIDHLSRGDKNQLWSDVDFFQLHSLLNPPAIRFQPVPKDAPVKLDNNRTTLSTIRCSGFLYHAASFPEAGPKGGGVKYWTVVACKNKQQAPLSGRVGVGDAKDPTDKTSITVGIGGGLLYNQASQTSAPFVTWPSGVDSCSVDFRYDPTSRFLTIRALGNTITRTLPDTWDPVPVVGCANNGISFTMKTAQQRDSLATPLPIPLSVSGPEFPLKGSWVSVIPTSVSDSAIGN
eukprot:TRINITY_DN52047_c0_g1_i1.p1 TRINITY_DN52047_c0_g1~~TRINITY_DN52047_c0_g1_i1.p1  ORF type:complete len:378 (-),score=36.03 TRINITY_DN52047_c0_g1_i1:198-1331(-)